MATVTSFDGVRYPSRSDLRQFAELFTPLFQASSDEAKRQAVAALSQSEHIPAAVALFIGSQPIGIAAPFLTSSKAIDDDTLITIARTQGAAHARAIVSRNDLSPKVIDALVGLRHADPSRGGNTGALPMPAQDIGALTPPDAAREAAETEARAREEKVRQELKQLARHLAAPADDRLGLRSLSDMQEALLIRFARERNAGQFSTTLADTLSTSRWLAERILLDISGQQLAMTLVSVGMAESDIVFTLENFYPHLADASRGSFSRARLIVEDIDPADCEKRVEAWRRADRYTYMKPDEVLIAAANRPQDLDRADDLAPLRRVANRR